MGIAPIHPIRYPKPQKEWREILAVYLYLAGMGAGSFIIGTLIHWLGVKLNTTLIPSIDLFGYAVNLSKLPIFWGPIMVAISAPCLILDLGIKWRFMYACLNPRTSWVARGFIILSIFIVLGLIVLTKSILPFECLHTGSVLWVILEIITFAFAFGTAFYTGMLLKATKSIPLWNTYLLPLLFLVSALSTGSMAIILSTLGSGLFSHDSGPLKVLMHGEQMLVVIEGIVLYLFLSRRYKAAEQGKDSIRLLLFGEMKLIFWVGIVLLGLIFPIILENIASLFHGNVVFIFIAGVLLLCGGFFLRLGILHTGIKERIPMHRLMDIQHNAIKNPKPEYRNLNLPVWNYNLKKGDWNAG
jgi:formate-dependent nitrite reductase membrane component NrfD